MSDEDYVCDARELRRAPEIASAESPGIQRGRLAEASRAGCRCLSIYGTARRVSS